MYSLKLQIAGSRDLTRSRQMRYLFLPPSSAPPEQNPDDAFKDYGKNQI